MYLNFDIMGAVGFSKDFHVLDNGREHSATRGLHDQMKTLGVQSSIPWFLSTIGSIPRLARSYAESESRRNSRIVVFPKGG